MRIPHKKTLLASLISLALGFSNVNADSIELKGRVRDFKADHPDFETTIVGHQTACVETTLGEEGKPVLNAKRSKACAITQFADWYHDTANSQASELALTLTQGTGQEAAIYTYDSATNPLTQVTPVNGGFFPIDGPIGNEGRKHNYHFTFEGHGEFTYKKGQTFSFRGDDDVWVFINKQLVVDIGGIHGAISRSVSLDNLGLIEGETYPLDLFFAERHTSESNFKVQTSIRLKPPVVDMGNGVSIEPLEMPAILDISQPSANSNWHLLPQCENPFITVTGKAALKELQPIDLALLIDTSGSTEKPAIKGKSVLENERLAAHALIDMLEKSGSDIKVSLVHFAREAKVLSTLTDDWATLRQAIDLLTTPEGGTYMALGMETALNTLAHARDGARKTILMITDGIPTLPIEDGLKQQAGDRKATLNRAKTARKADVRIYPIVIMPEEDQDKSLTTMPAVRAITGVPNTVPNLGLDNLDQLADVMQHTSMTDVSDVSVTNETTGQTVVGKVSLGGEFSVEVPVAVGDNQLTVKAHAGNPEQAISRSLTVPLLAAASGDSQPSGCHVVAQPACKVYAIHDQGAAHTQFFTLEVKKDGLGTVEKLGTLYKNHNIEGMDIHPSTQELIGISSGSQECPLYQINPNNADLKLLGVLKDAQGKAFRNVASLSFKNDGTLWGVARHGSKDNRLLKIDSKTATATVEAVLNVAASGIAWSKEGNTLWMVEGKDLYTWDAASQKVTKAFTIKEPKISAFEGLEMRPDGLLMLGAHTGGSDLVLYNLDPATGEISSQTKFDSQDLNDVEALAWPQQCGVPK